MNKFLGIALVVVAVALAVVPAFTDCQSQGKAIVLANGKTVPMKCHWTGVGEIAVGVPLIGIGAMMIPSRRKTNLMNLGIMGIILGIMAVLLPNQLIGVCSTSMLCNTVMQPALTTLGGLVIAGSLGGLVLSLRRKDTE